MCLKNDFHFTCLGTKKFLHLLPFKIVLDPNPKSSRSSQMQFFWEIHLYFDSFEAVCKLTRHFEYQELLNTITHNVDLFVITSGFKDELSLWLMKTHDLVNSLSIPLSFTISGESTRRHL